MISIKRFLEQRRNSAAPEQDVVEALTQMVRLLLDAMATHMVRGNETDYRSLRHALNGLAVQMEQPQTAMNLLSISSDAAEALETYCDRTTRYFRERHEERQSMIAMLTEAVADLSGQTDVSVARLQAIEKQVELASELNDIRTLKTQLGDSLHALREAAAQQRSSSAATVARLRGQIAKSRQPTSDHPKEPPKTPVDDAAAGLMPEPSDDRAEPVPTSYVAAFKLQRADHIASRFGEPAKTQMLSLIAAKLKTVLGPSDRLLRWKGTSFVMFIDSPETIQDVRVRLAGVVAETSQQYIEVGRKSTLLSVGVDWIVFPQSGRANLDVVFAEVDSFLANTRQVPAQAAALR